jgi:2-polyprenyl-3-methyl-5-hydroxy-6-metoxy-1,4-benzoquinol methylase
MTQRTVDYAKRLNWNKVSKDYLLHRNGYPASFFTRLKDLGIGAPKQTILDLGTGTGALAVPFAQQGSVVTGVDPAEGQIEAAKERAKALGLWVNFLVLPAEHTQLPDSSFDVVTASMAWGYIDKKTGAAEVKRLLKPKGRFLISSILWSAENGSVAERTNYLIARYNPEYGRQKSSDDKSYGLPEWAQGYFTRPIREDYVETLRFTKEAWRGRIRASKWIGAALSPDRVEAFDRDHREILEKEPDELQLTHRIKLEIFESA